MLKAKRITQAAGQTYIVLTADQQLNKVAVDILWDNPELFQNMNLRLSGMHHLMSYIGVICNLMDGTCLEEILSSMLGGVKKMLVGQMFPENE